MIFIGCCTLCARTLPSSSEHFRTYDLLCHVLHFFHELFAKSLQECYTSKSRQWTLTEFSPGKQQHNGKLWNTYKTPEPVCHICTGTFSALRNSCVKQKPAAASEGVLRSALVNSWLVRTHSYDSWFEKIEGIKALSKKRHDRTAELLYGSFGYHPLLWTIWNSLCLRQCNTPWACKTSLRYLQWVYAYSPGKTTKNDFWNPMYNTVLAQKNLVRIYVNMVCIHKMFYPCLWATFINALFCPVLLETISVMTIKIHPVLSSFSTSQREDNDMQ